MGLCALAITVLLLSMVGILMDIYLFGSSILALIINVLVTCLFVGITNWSCYNQTYNWLAWIIVIVSLFSVMATAYFVKNRKKESVKKILEQERKDRAEYGF